MQPWTTNISTQTRIDVCRFSFESAGALALEQINARLAEDAQMR